MQIYRRPKFLEALISIRNTMADEADHDVRTLVRLIVTDPEPEDGIVSSETSLTALPEAETKAVEKSTGPTKVIETKY